MAIFHLHIASYQRSRGRTAVGGAAYRRGLKAACEASGKRFNFRSKEEVLFSEFSPAQNDLTDYTQLRNLLKLYEVIERTEKHPRATLGREIEAALPIELTLPQQVELVRKFVEEVRQHFGAKKAFFDFSIHAEPNNPHAHICMSEREQIAPFVFEKTKRRDWDGEKFVSACRKLWQTQTNFALEKAGKTQRVDCRSHAERGLEVLPALHEGKAAYFPSEVKKMNEKIKLVNQQLLKAPTYPTTPPPPEEDFMTIYMASLPPQEWGNIENADTDRTNSKYQYRLATKIYDGFNLYGLTYCQAKNPKYVVLWFIDKSKIVDNGNEITSTGGTAQDAAQRVVELAKLKGWQIVRLSGSLAFVEAAMINALAAGLDVSPIDDEQRELWERIQATEKAATVEQVNANAAPIAPLSLKALGAKLGNRGGDPASQKPRQRGLSLGL